MVTSVEQDRNNQSTRSVFLAAHAHHPDSSAPTYGKSRSENLGSWRDWWTPLISAALSAFKFPHWLRPPACYDPLVFPSDSRV